MKQVVVKVGGSLLRWKDLSPALNSFFQARADCSLIIVPGGGPTADIVRQWDTAHQLGEEASHWLALASMTLNAHFLSNLLHDIPIVVEKPEVTQTRSIINPLAFCRREDTNSKRVPHCWQATSDAVAARIAEAFDINELVLMKSADPPAGEIEDWAKASYIDSVFPAIIRRANIKVTCINLLAWPLD